MRKLFAYLLICAFSFQVLGSLLTITAYEMNRDYIAKNFCINRNKPKSHCNGKCHLMKELQKEEKKSDCPSSSLKDKNETVQYSDPGFDIRIEIQSQVTTITTVYLEHSTFQFKQSIFHPPLV